jgi:hypothetical protein
MPAAIKLIRMEIVTTIVRCGPIVAAVGVVIAFPKVT